MAVEKSTCALIADQHTVFVEGLRDLLRTEFNSVYIVGDANSLRDGAHRLHPTVIVVDISSARNEALELIAAMREISPASKLITLTTHDEPGIAEMAFSAGADAVVLKRCVAVDLMDAVDAVRQNRKFVSRDMGAVVPQSVSS